MKKNKDKIAYRIGVIIPKYPRLNGYLKNVPGTVFRKGEAPFKIEHFFSDESSDYDETLMDEYFTQEEVALIKDYFERRHPDIELKITKQVLPIKANGYMGVSAMPFGGGVCCYQNHKEKRYNEPIEIEMYLDTRNSELCKKTIKEQLVENYQDCMEEDEQMIKDIKDNVENEVELIENGGFTCKQICPLCEGSFRAGYVGFVIKGFNSTALICDKCADNFNPRLRFSKEYQRIWEKYDKLFSSTENQKA